MKKSSLINLENKIKTAAQNYYVGNTTISDNEFDLLVDTLKKEDPENKLIKQVGWGYDVAQVAGNKINHKYGVVGSLDKIHNIDELPKNYSDDLILTAKLDGASCVAYYENGVLLCALSRGDGEIGVECTEKYKKIVEKNNLDLMGFTGAIRGEIVFSNTNWEKYLQKYPDAKFPRNIATGLFMRADISDDLEYINFVAYKIHGSPEYANNILYSNILSMLNQYGFDVVPYAQINKLNINNEFMRDVFCDLSREYPLDGIVIQNDIVCISLDGYFNYKNIAYKFQAEEKETDVIRVDWNLSKNNILVPLVWVQPVDLSGAVVQKASGFNYENIVKNKICEKARIKIRRSGEVIPDITEILIPSDNVYVPQFCPECGAPVTVSGKELICNNQYCGNIEKARFISWVETLGVRNMLGVGPAILEDFYNNYKKCINKIPVVDDLYKQDTSFDFDILLKERFLSMFTPSVSEKLREVCFNLYQPAEIAKIIYALNIRGLGKAICEKISDIVFTAFQETTIEKQDKHLDKISKISGIGLDAQNRVKNARELFSRLLYTIPALQSNLPEKSQRIARIVVTGSVSIPRKQFEALLDKYDIELSDNVNGADYLVTNNPNSGSSKIVKAQKLKVKIISEREFYSIYNIQIPTDKMI